MTKQITDIDLVAADLKTLGTQFYGQSGMTGKFTGETFIMMWKMILEQGIGALFVSFDDSGKLTGVLGMMMCPGMFDGKVTAQESFWFVTPEARGGMTGVRLFRQAIDWCQKVKVERLLMGRLMESMPAKVEDFYIANGFKVMETIYMKEFKW